MARFCIGLVTKFMIRYVVYIRNYACRYFYLHEWDVGSYNSFDRRYMLCIPSHVGYVRDLAIYIELPLSQDVGTQLASFYHYIGAWL